MIHTYGVSQGDLWLIPVRRVYQGDTPNTVFELLSEIREIMRGNVLVLTVCSTMWRMSVEIVWGARVSITAGTLLIGYVYRFNNSLPWVILSISIAALGVLMIVLIKDTEQTED